MKISLLSRKHVDKQNRLQKARKAYLNMQNVFSAVAFPSRLNAHWQRLARWPQNTAKVDLMRFLGYGPSQRLFAIDETGFAQILFQFDHVSRFQG